MASLALGESRAYTIDYTDIGTPSAPGTVVAYNSAGTDVSGTMMSGVASLLGAVVTLKLFTPSAADTYRLISTVTIGGQAVIGAVDVRGFSLVPGTGITNGYTTRQAVLDLIRARSTEAVDDTVVDALINGASRYFDLKSGRTFYARTETHTFDVPGGRELWMDDDLLTVTTLTNGNAEVLTTADYF